MRKLNFIGFDFETTNKDNPQVYSWGAMDEDNNYTDGISDKSFIDFIQNLTKDYIGFFHNGGKFDLHFLVPILDKYGFKQVAQDTSKKHLETIDESPYLNEMRNNNEGKFELKENEYMLLVNENFKIMSLKIGLKSKKKTWSKKEEQNFYKNRVLLIHDSLLLFPATLKSFGESLNSHYKTDIYTKKELVDGYFKEDLYKDYKEFETDQNEKEYLKQDCFILISFLKMMGEVIPRFKWKMTSAGTFYEIWKKDFIGKDLIKNELEKGTLIKVEKNEGYTLYHFKNKKKEYTSTQIGIRLFKKFFPTSWLDEVLYEELPTSQFLYDGYNGGLTMANQDYIGIEIKNMLYVDINSSYPTQMKKGIYPWGTPKKGDVKNYPIKLLRIVPTSNVINRKGIPFLAKFNLEQGSKLYQKEISKNEGEWIIWDIVWERVKKYYEGDFKVEVLFSFKAIDGEKIFGEYINYFYNMKSQAKESNDVAKTISSKLALNSLYGKFGQKTLITSRIWNSNNQDWEKDTSIYKSSFYLPLAMRITAYAQLYLIDAVGDNFNLVAYMDTDSLIVCREHLNKFNLELDKFELGKWDKEADNLNGLVRRAKQYYFIDDEGTHKLGYAGIRFHNKSILHNNLFIYGFCFIDQLRPKRFPTGIQLENSSKEIKSLWDYNPHPDSWFKSYDDYINNYESQKTKLLNYRK